MTYQSPRIYTYKITFEEVPYYYYGVHKEKKFNEEYWGSPITNKWCWDLYTPKKQILELFDYSDEGWLKAQEIEKRIIKSFYNNDNWCLNANCAGALSIQILSETARRNKQLGVGIFSLDTLQLKENGKKGGKISVELGVGVHGMSTEKRTEIGKKNYDLSLGIHALTSTQKSNAGKIGGTKTYELGLGVHSLTKEQKSELGKKTKEMGVGIHGLTKEQRIENSKKNGIKNREMNIGICKLTTEERRKNVQKTNAQRWMCLETGYVSTPSGLSQYQKKRGIDTSKRKRIL